MSVFSRSTGRLFPPPITILSVLIGIAGVVALIQGVWLAVIPFFFGFVGVFLSQGCEVDIAKKVYRYYWGLPGMKSGKWKNLPPIDKLTITTDKQVFSSNLTMGGAQMHSTNVTFNLNLKINNRDRIIAASGPYKQMLQDAELLADLLQLDILDCSTKEKKLIKHAELNRGFENA